MLFFKIECTKYNFIKYLSSFTIKFSEMTTILKVENLQKSFGNFQVLNQLSFEVYKGDIYGFLGPNGAGKSTTLRIILGLVKSDNGKITFLGNTISFYDKYYLKDIGALIERPDFYGNLSAYDNLWMIAELSNLINPSNRINEVLDLVNLLPRKKSKVKTFSQGMKQRLGIAQAILHKPKFVILDEPSNGLDPQGQADIRNIIRTINQHDNITILFSSHILSEVEEICNRMLIINNGRKIKEGKVDELMSEDRMQVSIRVDNMQKLIDLLSSLGYIFFVDTNQIFTEIKENEIPQLVQNIVANNINIFEVNQNRSLENYFLKLTKN